MDDHVIQIRTICRFFSRKPLFILGIIASIILVFYNFTLPYRNVSSSKFFSFKKEEEIFSGEATSLKSKRFGMFSLSRDAKNSSYPKVILDKLNFSDYNNVSEIARPDFRDEEMNVVSKKELFISYGSGPSDDMDINREILSGFDGGEDLKNFGDQFTWPITQEDTVNQQDIASIGMSKEVGNEFSFTSLNTTDLIFKSNNVLHGDVTVPFSNNWSKKDALAETSSSHVALTSSLVNSSAGIHEVYSNSIELMKGTSFKNDTKLPIPSSISFSPTIDSKHANILMRSKPGRLPISVSEMKQIMLTSHSSNLKKNQRHSALDKRLLAAKELLQNVPLVKNDEQLYEPAFWSISIFKRDQKEILFVKNEESVEQLEIFGTNLCNALDRKIISNLSDFFYIRFICFALLLYIFCCRSYELMERILKIYVYKEGNKPVFHQPLLRGIYASEGWLMKLLQSDRHFVVRDYRKAHLFYLPFSSRLLQLALYDRNSHSHRNLAQHLKNYVDLIATKYPYWNRTGGADHFAAACHDWAPHITAQAMGTSIRALCNADLRKGFQLGKDVSLPEIYVRSARNPLRDIGGNSADNRSTLAFYAGNLHGRLRPVLLQYWENKDPDLKILGPMPAGVESKMIYIKHMKNSKYCICPRGYEVNSPRVVESIYYECVPVILSDNYVPPFFEVLNWEAFSVIIPEEDVPRLKEVLVSIPEERYRLLQLGVRRVQQHFLWHNKPVKFDLFHMILHSLWHNRLLQIGGFP